MESQQTPKEGTSATNSAVVSGYKGKYIVEPYSSIDADIILVASDTVDRWEDEHIVNCCQAFKVHKEKLRRASTVFKDMLDCGVDEQEGASELPHVHLTETSAVIRALLGGVYANERDKIVPLESLDWHVCKQVWEAARKYELHMLAAYAGDILV